jgi:hypothetical protein
MVVFLHVIIALGSLGLVTYSYFKPSKNSFVTGYISIAATILSGVYLVWSEPTRMLHTCIVGLVYVAIVSLAVVAARARFAHLRSHTSVS